MDLKDSPDHRMVQVFMSRQSGKTFEVYWHIVSDTYHCTCPGSELRGDCVHLKFVLGRVSSMGGYPLEIESDASREHIAELMGDHRKFRTFVLEKAKVEMVGG